MPTSVAVIKVKILIKKVEMATETEKKEMDQETLRTRIRRVGV